jgi:PTS system mannose-specific IID component
MSRISRRVRLAVLLRSFLIQGSWNYRTLIGGGFAFALLPVLRALHGRDRARLEEAIERHSRIFNGHPYLVPLALGAVSKMEVEGETGAGVERFKNAIRGSLGALGDRLVWVGWRPVCLLLTLALLLAGAPWWAGIAGFLLLYNAGHLALRGWSFRVGLADPRRIGQELRRPTIDRGLQWVAVGGAFLVGLVLPLVIAGLAMPEGAAARNGAERLLWWLVGAAGAVIGVRLGGRIRTAVILALAGCTILGISLGMIR